MLKMLYFQWYLAEGGFQSRLINHRFLKVFARIYDLIHDRKIELRLGFELDRDRR